MRNFWVHHPRHRFRCSGSRGGDTALVSVAYDRQHDCHPIHAPCNLHILDCSEILATRSWSSLRDDETYVRSMITIEQPTYVSINLRTSFRIQLIACQIRVVAAIDEVIVQRPFHIAVLDCSRCFRIIDGRRHKIKKLVCAWMCTSRFDWGGWKASVGR